MALPGIETSSGPLAQGTSQAVGMALALKMDHLKNHVYLIMSDGEQQEGQTWEAVMFAGFFIYRFKQIHPESNISDDLSAIMDSNKTRLDQILLHAFLGGPDPWVSQPPPASNNYDETYPDYQQD